MAAAAGMQVETTWQYREEDFRPATSPQCLPISPTDGAPLLEHGSFMLPPPQTSETAKLASLPPARRDSHGPSITTFSIPLQRQRSHELSQIVQGHFEEMDSALSPSVCRDKRSGLF